MLKLNMFEGYEKLLKNCEVSFKFNKIICKNRDLNIRFSMVQNSINKRFILRNDDVIALLPNINLESINFYDLNMNVTNFGKWCGAYLDYESNLNVFKSLIEEDGEKIEANIFINNLYGVKKIIFKKNILPYRKNGPAEIIFTSAPNKEIKITELFYENGKKICDYKKINEIEYHCKPNSEKIYVDDLEKIIKNKKKYCVIRNEESGIYWGNSKLPCKIYYDEKGRIEKVIWIKRNAVTRENFPAKYIFLYDDDVVRIYYKTNGYINRLDGPAFIIKKMSNGEILKQKYFIGGKQIDELTYYVKINCE